MRRRQLRVRHCATRASAPRTMTETVVGKKSRSTHVTMMIDTLIAQQRLHRRGTRR